MGRRPDRDQVQAEQHASQQPRPDVAQDADGKQRRHDQDGRGPARRQRQRDQDGEVEQQAHVHQPVRLARQQIAG